MYPIDRLTIHQFRGLQELTLDELGQFNVLVGLNNAGKTTVLEAVATYCRPLRPSEWVDVVRRREVSSSRTALLEGLCWVFPQTGSLAAPAGQLYRGLTRISSEGSFCVKESIAEYEQIEGFLDDSEGELFPSMRGGTGQEESGVRHGARLRFKAKVRASDEADATVQEKLYQNEYELWETGRGPIPQASSGPVLPVVTITPFSHRSQLVEVEAFSDAVLAERKAEVLELMRLFDPDIQSFEVLKRARSEATVYLQHSRLGKAPLGTFGEGMRRVLFLGVSLAAAKDGVVLVDEIEAAIHVQALDQSFRWLQKACATLNVQLFATTHSLEALDALLVDSDDAHDLVVYRLEHKGEKTEARRFSRERLRVLREELGQEIRA